MVIMTKTLVWAETELLVHTQHESPKASLVTIYSMIGEGERQIENCPTSSNFYKCAKRIQTLLQAFSTAKKLIQNQITNQDHSTIMAHLDILREIPFELFYTQSRTKRKLYENQQMDCIKNRIGNKMRFCEHVEGKKRVEKKSPLAQKTQMFESKMTRMMNGSILKFTGVTRNTF